MGGAHRAIASCLSYKQVDEIDTVFGLPFSWGQKRATSYGGHRIHAPRVGRESVGMWLGNRKTCGCVRPQTRA